MRYLQRKKAVRELDSIRTKVSQHTIRRYLSSAEKRGKVSADEKNCRFYGELAKFKVARPYAILHPLKIFLDDFKPNIENISNLLETCGRFLLRNEGTAETAKQMVSNLSNTRVMESCCRGSVRYKPMS